MALVNSDDLKGNSYAERERQAEAEERRKLAKVGSGQSKKMKKSLSRRFIETFISDDVTKQDVKDFIIKDIIVPSIQDAIMDGINGALGMMFGIGIVRKGSSRGSSGSSGGKIRYGGYFNGGNSQKSSKSSSARENRRDIRSGFEVQMKDSKDDALKIMDELNELLDTYPEEGVSVADYYDAFGVTTEHTDNKFGWMNLDGMHLERVPRAFYDEDTRRYSDGFAVVMPRVEAL